MVVCFLLFCFGEYGGNHKIEIEKSAGIPQSFKNIALLTNWVWLVGKSDFKIMFPRELFLFSLLYSNRLLLVWESSLALNGIGLLTKHPWLGDRKSVV